MISLADSHGATPEFWVSGFNPNTSILYVSGGPGTERPQSDYCSLSHVRHMRVVHVAVTRSDTVGEHFTQLCVYSRFLESVLKVHYATFLRAINKQKNRVLDARNSSLQVLR